MEAVPYIQGKVFGIPHSSAEEARSFSSSESDLLSLSTSNSKKKKKKTKIFSFFLSTRSEAQKPVTSREVIGLFYIQLGCGRRLCVFLLLVVLDFWVFAFRYFACSVFTRVGCFGYGRCRVFVVGGVYLFFFMDRSVAVFMFFGVNLIVRLACLNYKRLQFKYI